MYTQIVEFINTHNFQLITYHALAKLPFTISRGFQGQPEPGRVLILLTFAYSDNFYGNYMFNFLPVHPCV